MMFFSGMVGGEIMQLVDLFNGLNIPPSIFACAVPNNWDGKVRELIDEIADDHKVMMEREKEKLAEMGNAETVNSDAASKTNERRQAFYRVLKTNATDGPRTPESPNRPRCPSSSSPALLPYRRRRRRHPSAQSPRRHRARSQDGA